MQHLCALIEAEEGPLVRLVGQIGRVDGCAVLLLLGGELISCVNKDGQGRLVLSRLLLWLWLLGLLPLGKLLTFLRRRRVHVKITSLQEVDVVVRG